MLLFEFNPRKAAANLRKHKVSFSEAMSVFNDPFTETFPDDLHSQEEDRFITIGLSSKHRILFISHQEDGDCIRLIGARRATAAEKRAYEDLKERP
jgi:hypothetical protein